MTNVTFSCFPPSAEMSGEFCLLDSMKYIKMDWPEIQDYMDRPDYPEECYFDPQKNFWFIPEQWVTS